MASFRFNLNKKPNAKGLDVIMIHISYCIVTGKYAKLPLSSGLFVKPKEWLQKNQRVSKKDYMHESKNKALTKFDILLNELLIEATVQNKTGNNFVEWIKEKWERRGDDLIEVIHWTEKSIWPDWDDYIRMKKNEWASNTLRSKNTDYKTLKLFETYDKTPVTWGGIDMDFYTRLVNWCYDEQEFVNSNVGRLIKGLKTMMDWCFNNDRHQNLTYKKKDFNKPKYFKSKISFTGDELRTFYDLKLNHEFDERVRDGVCFSCFTGLRYSDIKLLTKANVINGWLHLVTQKTTAPIVIPLCNEALAIIARYENEPTLIPLPSDQKCNKAIHKLLKRHEFNREIELLDIVRKEKVRTVKPLHEVFTFHCSKKTFFTLFKKYGGDTNVGMSITGNTDEKTVRSSYEDIGEDLKRQQMTDVWAMWRVSAKIL